MKKYWIVENENIHPENLEILNEYLLDLKLTNKSKQTIMEYSWFLQRFLIFINKPVTDLVSDDIFDWTNEKCGCLKPATKNRHLAVISAFIQFCQQEEYLSEDVQVKSRWRPKLPKTQPKYLDKEELAKVKLAAENFKLRDRALFEFLLTSGSRVGEAVGLDIEDLDLENRTARVTGKGNKTRDVHFSESCALLLEKLLENHPGNTSAVFLNRWGNRMHVRSVQNIMAKIGEKAGLNRKLTPHCLRHTFSTYILSKGADIEFISEELGHANLATTCIYARVLDEQVVATYRKCMG
jgi:integrase/recombinase XerD